MRTISYEHTQKKQNSRIGECYTCFGRETKMGVVRISVIFKMDLGSATSMESSRRDLSKDMAEERCILKNNQNKHHPRFGFTPKAGIAYPKRVFCFYCVESFSML